VPKTKSNTAFIEELLSQTGNSWLSEDYLHQVAKKLKGNASLSFLNADIKSGNIVARKVEGKVYITLPSYASAEASIALNILRVMDAPHRVYSDKLLDEKIDAVEKIKGLKLHIGQRDAVKAACNNLFLILTGGPGTGKTCVLNVINDVLLMLGDKNILYCAPTGKAARRISESTGFDAKTAHRLLEINPDKMEPKPFDKSIDTTICDEVSMLDAFLAEAFLKAVQTGQRVVWVGDTDQLPSVGSGAVLRDIISSEVVPVARLTKTFRQKGESDLADNIQLIKNGDYHLHAGKDFHLSKPVDGCSAMDQILLFYKQEVEKYGVQNVMVLTPYRQHGDTCSIEVNKRIQQIVNPNPRAQIKVGREFYRTGDMVMFLQNDDDASNGDIGVITGVIDNMFVSIRVNGKNVMFDKYELSGRITLAYAMSIHKSQGSEAKSVITLMLNEHETMLQRNLLYTAVTRAKKECFLICEPEAVKKAIETEASCLRTTMLSEYLKMYAEKKHINMEVA
jgi:exodeoxyribonuclease V alpha subunit